MSLGRFSSKTPGGDRPHSPADGTQMVSGLSHVGGRSATGLEALGGSFHLANGRCAMIVSPSGETVAGLVTLPSLLALALATSGTNPESPCAPIVEDDTILWTSTHSTSSWKIRAPRPLRARLTSDRVAAAPPGSSYPVASASPILEVKGLQHRDESRKYERDCAIENEHREVDFEGSEGCG